MTAMSAPKKLPVLFPKQVFMPLFIPGTITVLPAEVTVKIHDIEVNSLEGKWWAGNDEWLTLQSGLLGAHDTLIGFAEWSVELCDWMYRMR